MFSPFKIRITVLFLIVNWRDMSFKTFRVFLYLNVKCHRENKFHGDLEHLQTSDTTVES